MKKIILSIIIIFYCLTLSAFFQFIYDNPAHLADKTNNELYLPLSSIEINANNSLLNFDNLSIFQTNRIMSDSEKKILTEDDLYLDFYFRDDIINISYQNIGFAWSLIGFGKGNILDKTYSKLIFYGNEDYEYEANNFEKAKTCYFSKFTFTYAYPKKLTMNFLSGITLSNKHMKNILTYLETMPIYAGINMNLYYPYFYGYVPESSQTFGTTYDGTYGTYDIRLQYSDEDSDAKLNWGLGMGMKFKLPDGWINFAIDDLFTRLEFSNIIEERYIGTYEDSLTHFEDGYEPINETSDEKLRVGDKGISLKPNLKFGLEHRIYKQYNLMLRYQKSSFDYKDGFSVGVGNEFLNIIPAQLVLGFDENVYYELRSGIEVQNFEYLISTTFYHGFFKYARGIGIQTGMKYKF